MPSLKSRFPKFVYKNGRIYFSRQTERRFFFLLTMALLLAGALIKLGVI